MLSSKAEIVITGAIFVVEYKLDSRMGFFQIVHFFYNFRIQFEEPGDLVVEGGLDGNTDLIIFVLYIFWGTKVFSSF